MMIKKRLFICTLAFFISFRGAGKLFALGAGAQAGFFPSVLINEDGIEFSATEANVTGTFRLSRLPLVFGVGFTAGRASEEVPFSAGASAFADWWALDCQIKNTWNVYSGFGLAGGIKTDFSSATSLTAGARFFVGMNWLFLDNYIEYYVQQNVMPSIYIPLATETGRKDFMMYFPLETGLRLHF